MKIAIYCKDYWPIHTGFSIAFRGFAEAVCTARPEWEVVVITPIPDMGMPSESNPQNLSVIRLPQPFEENYGSLDRRRGYVPSKRGRIVSAVSTLVNRFYWGKQVVRIAAEHKADLLLFESGDEAITLAVCATSGGVPPIAVRIHSTGDTENAFFGSGGMRRLERFLLRYIIAPKVDVVFSTNQFHLDFVKKFYYRSNPFALARRYLAVVPNVVRDIELRRNARKYRSSSISPEHPLVMMTLGRMDASGVAQKGFDDIIFAVAGLTDNQRDSLVINVVGDGAGLENLQEKVRVLGLQDCIRFLGRLDNKDVHEKLNESDVVLLASRFEGQSMFAIEGLLCGCAAIFSNAGGLADLVVDNGWSFEAQNISSLKGVIELALCSSPQVLQSLGEKSRAYALRSFSELTVGELGARQLQNALLFCSLR